MRSVNAPRVAHDATVEIGAGGRARAVNLSTGGIFVTAEERLDPGEQVHLKVNLRDGASPLDVDAEVVRRDDGGMAMRFKQLDDVARRRIQRLVQKREPTQFGKRDVRIHLPSLSAPLRASARDLTERGVMLEAELPWLRLGSQVTTELSPERACEGRVQWIGLDVTRSGSARLRIFVDLAEESVEGALPPATAFVADDALPTASAPPRSPAWHRWVWPSIAMAGLIATAGLSGALLRQPPTAVLLPTAPPERDAPAVRMPKQLTVPAEKTEEPALTASQFFGPEPQPEAPAAVRAKPQPAGAPAKAAPHPKPASKAKKRARVMPRAG
jgi:PilZ domain